MFNNSTIEKDIERLGQEVKEKRDLPEHKELSEKELVKRTLQPMVKQATPINPPANGQGDDKKKEIIEAENVLPNYLKDSSDEIKDRVERLVEMVFNQGLEKAVREAVKAGGFILDAFHDALTDKLYDELKKRKLI